MADLRTKLQDAGLDEYADQLAADRIDAKLLATMSEQEIVAYAQAWPLGDRMRLRQLCAQLRAEAGGAAEPPCEPSATTTSGNPEAAAPLQEKVAWVPEHGPNLPPEASIDPALVQGLPLIIAQPLVALLQERDSFRIVHGTTHLVDVTLRFIALVSQADYMSHPRWQDEDINASIDTDLAKPSLGHWQTLIAKLLKSGIKNRVEPFLQQLPESWRAVKDRPTVSVGEEIFDEFGSSQPSSGDRSIVDALTSTRNAYAHSRRSPSDAATAEQYRVHACLLVRHLAWLASFELFLATPDSSTLLRGLQPVSRPDGPRSISGKSSLVIRRAAARSPSGTESRLLDLQPLIVPEAAIRESGRSSEPTLYNGRDLRHETIWFTPVGPHETAIGSNRLNDAYRSLRERKRYTVLGRDALTPDILRDRVSKATERSLRQLETSGKYRPSFHVQRENCEPRLQPWIHSPKPLLGIEARPGAGKTGVLATLARHWISDGSGPPVLLALARDFQASTIDQVVARLLVLDEDVFLDFVCEHLLGLVLVIDGLNECPTQHREAVLNSIMAAAERRHRTGVGPRFVISWRDDDREWIAPRLKRRELWWMPKDSTPKDQVPSEAGAGTTTAKAGQEPSAQNQGPEAKQSDARAHAGISTQEPCFLLKPLSDAELATIWRHYQQQSEATRGRLAPRFDFEELRRRSMRVAGELRNPLTLRIAMELFHGRPLPSEISSEGLFSEYLRQLQSQFPPAGELLDVLAALMARDQSGSISQYAIEDRNRNLIHQVPASALDFLREKGVVSTRVERNQPMVSFTNERVAEQVLGEWLASHEQAMDPRWLAQQCAELQALNIASGAVRVALSIGMDRHRMEYLLKFIDAEPPGIGTVAGHMLADRLRDASEEGAQELATALIAEPTGADFEVALSAVWGAGERDEVDDETILAFLDALREPMLEASSSSDAAFKLCLIYDNQLEAEPSLAWLHELVAAWDGETHHERRALALGRIAKKLSGRGSLDEALPYADRAVEAARQSRDRKRLALCLRIRGEILLKAKRADEAAACLRESLNTALLPKPDDQWDADDTETVSRSLARSLLAAGRGSEAVEVIHASMQAWRDSSGDPEVLAYAAARLADDALDIHASEDAERLARLAVERAEDSEDRGIHARALEWLGDILRKLGREADAVPAYERALERGMQPSRVPNWYPSSPLYEMARCLRAMKLPERALQCELRCLEWNLADDDLAGASTASSRVADLHMELGTPEEARQAAERSVELALQSEDRRQIALAHEWLGVALHRMGQPGDAIPALDQALQTGLHPESVARWSPAPVRSKLAECYRDLKRWDEALDAEQACLDFELADDNLADAARTCARMADLESERDGPAAARTWSQQSIELARASGDSALEAWAHVWHGNQLLEFEDPEGALDAFMCALKSSPDAVSGGRWCPGNAHSGIAECLRKLDRSHDAQLAELEAFEAFTKAGARVDAAISASVISDAFLEEQQSSHAIAWSTRSIELARQSDDDGQIASSLCWHGDLLKNLRRPHEALPFYEQAIHHGEETDPGDWDPQRVRAAQCACLKAMDRHDEAIRIATAAALAATNSNLAVIAQASGILSIIALDSRSVSSRWVDFIRSVATRSDVAAATSKADLAYLHANEAQFLTWSGDPSNALAACRSAAQLSSGCHRREAPPEIFAAIATNFARLQRAEDAESALEPRSDWVRYCVNADSGAEGFHQEQPWLALGEIACANGRWSEAAQLLDTACRRVRFDGEEFDAFHSLARALSKSGDRAGARAAIQQMIDGISRAQSPVAAAIECARLARDLPADMAELARDAATLAVKHVQKVVQPGISPEEGQAWLTCVLARCGRALVQGTDPKVAAQVRTTLLNGLKSLERARRDAPSELLQRTSVRVSCTQGWEWVAEMLRASGKAAEADQARCIADAWRIDVGAILDRCIAEHQAATERAE
jgi:tetratricopeptide (TPR) repeat protein